MSFKPFYIHYNRFQPGVFSKVKKSFPVAATFYIAPHDTEERMVVIKTALCSNKDNFCRATGRQVAYNKETGEVVNRRDAGRWVTNKLVDVGAMVYHPTSSDPARLEAIVLRSII